MSVQVGRNIYRKEDPRFLTGHAQFIDEVVLPQMLYAGVHRSHYASAKIRKIDFSRAMRVSGVVACLTGDEIAEYSKEHGRPDRYVREGISFLARGKVLYAGQGVAAVAAEDRATAEDACELIDVDYESLPALLDAEEAIKKGAPKIHDGGSDEDGNISYKYKLKAGDFNQASKNADYIFREKFVTSRPHPSAIEPTGCVTHYDSVERRLTVWLPAQTLFFGREELSDITGIPQNRIRVIVPDIGGSFGGKGGLHSHYIVACLLSIKTGRPVKIIHSRKDELLATGQAFSSTRYVEMVVSKQGRVLGWKEKIIIDTGAHRGYGTSTLVKPSVMLPGPYKIENVLIEGYCVYTNKTGGSPVRGFGSPEAVFTRERMMDIAAKEIGMDPLEFRLKNVIQPHEVPYKSSTGPIYDSPNFALSLQKVAAAIGWDDVSKQQESGIGLGLALVTKNSGGYHITQIADYESAYVRIEPDGTVTLTVSSIPQGQSHETTLAQICAEELGISIEDVNIVHGDTNSCPYGLGSYGSRTAVITGSAVKKAVSKLVDTMKLIAAHNLGCSSDNLIFENNSFYVQGTSKKMSMREILNIAYLDPRKLPPNVEPTLQAIATFDPPGKEFFDENGRTQLASVYDVAAFGVKVKVDRETGAIRIVDYAAALDSGTEINPMVVDGQTHGAMAHGIGVALYENIVCDDAGQPLNVTFTDYLLPTSMNVPNILKIFKLNSPAVNIPGGQRGAGETGALGIPAAIANAVSDAVGVKVSELPINPEKVFRHLK